MTYENAIFQLLTFHDKYKFDKKTKYFETNYTETLLSSELILDLNMINKDLLLMEYIYPPNQNNFLISELITYDLIIKKQVFDIKIIFP